MTNQLLPDDPTAETLIEQRRSRSAHADDGRAQRDRLPLEAHADVDLPPERHPLTVLRAQDAGRLAQLIPIRWGRMSVSPFTFYRGAAAVMAMDLAAQPRTDLTVQLCGDAHGSNFGVFTSSDRRLVFDINDFDETLPGPFEWDDKRLAASIVIGGAEAGLPPKHCVLAATAAAFGYRRGMAEAAVMDPLDLWYRTVQVDDLARLAQFKRRAAAKQLAEVRSSAARKTNVGAFSKLTEVVYGRRRIRERPPLVVRIHPDDMQVELGRIAAFFEDYLETLPSDRRRLMARYSLADVAYKVVGVGSVGSRCLIGLFVTGDDEPLFLQIKQAVASVLEAHLGATTEEPAQRVVDGQRLLQSAPDGLLGWSRYHGEQGGQSYYVRQLWDGKASVLIEQLDAKTLAGYARLCGSVLAQAHARTGDSAAIAGYLGKRTTFDQAIGMFAKRYARVNRRDFAEARGTIESGEIVATPE